MKKKAEYKKLRFEKITNSHYKGFDRNNNHIIDIKQICQGSFFFWTACPIPCVTNGQFYYNIAYTRNQLKDMYNFISEKYTEYIKNQKEEKKKNAQKYDLY